MVLARLKPGRTTRNVVFCICAPHTVFNMFRSCALSEVKESASGLTKSVELCMDKAREKLFSIGGWATFPVQEFGVQVPGSQSNQMIVTTMGATLQRKTGVKVPSLRIQVRYEVRH